MIQIIELIAVGLFVAGIGVALHKAWDGFKTSIAAPYVQAQIKADQPKIDAAEAAQKQAEADRDQARGNLATVKQACDAQSAQVDAWKATAATNAKAARDAKAEAAKAATAAAPKIAELQAAAAAKPKLLACQDELAAANKVIDDALRARRGLKPAGAK